jgi:hypothetical protein
MSTLQSLAYKAIPRQKYHNVKNDPSMVIEREVLAFTKKEVMKFRNFKDWVETIKMPNKYIQSLLILFNCYTKRDYYIAYNTMRKKNRNYDLEHVGDYWDEIVEGLSDKILFDSQKSEDAIFQLWGKLKWPNILQKTYHCLCFRRLQGISNIEKEDIVYDSDHGEYMNADLFDAISKLPDSDILPLTIYIMISKYNKIFNSSRSARGSRNL